jgi:hypothetical protein
LKLRPPKQRPGNPTEARLLPASLPTRLRQNVCVGIRFRICFRKPERYRKRQQHWQNKGLAKLSQSKRKTLSVYRRRLKRQGVVRLEVNVRKEDAPLVRGVVKALGDPEREAEVRSFLRERFGATKPAGLKALLAAAPLEGIDLTRHSDVGRDVEL